MKEQRLLSAEIWNLQGALDTHSKKRGPGFSQAVLGTGSGGRAAVVWSNEYHLGLRVFWCGGSILLAILTSLVTDTVLSFKDPLLKTCNLKIDMQVSSEQHD